MHSKIIIKTAPTHHFLKKSAKETYDFLGQSILFTYLMVIKHNFLVLCKAVYFHCYRSGIFLLETKSKMFQWTQCIPVW